MKKKNLLVLLSIVEIVLVIVYLYSAYITASKTIELSIHGIASSWIDYKPVVLSESDKFFIKLSSILPYIILLMMIIRFIFVDKKKKIALGLFVLSVIFSVLCLANFDFEIVRFIGLLFLILALILYIYSHFINFKDESIVFEKKKKNKKK